MKWFYNLKVAAKLLISFILVAAIAGGLGVIAIRDMLGSDAQYADLYTDYGDAQGNISQVAVNFEVSRINLRDAIMAKPGDDKTKYVKNIETCDGNIKKYMDLFQKSIHRDDVQSEFAKLMNQIAQFNAERDKIVQLALADQDDVALVLMKGEAAKLAGAEQDSIDKLLEMESTIGSQTAAELAQETMATVKIMIIIVVMAVIVAVLLGIFISRIISKPVNKLAEAADKLAQGDVNVNVEFHTQDEIGKLAQSFSRMIAGIRDQALAVERISTGDLTVEVAAKSENDLLGLKLREMVGKNNEVLTKIANASEQVAVGSKQVSDTSIALSQGATEQASTIEELTASLEEIATHTKLNANNANEANQLAEDVKDNAVQGNTQMKEMLAAMDEINVASGNISKIIKVIDDIAFQTNILALNAAVEAARAGQHGKGFAVVAEEVRNLAARSANAAKETTDMIEGSIKKVDGGTRIAQETARDLNQIVSGIEKVASLVSHIAVASTEQAAGIEQVNQGIVQVSQVVQANSATSEESAAASEELSSQAVLLNDLVSLFKLRQNFPSGGFNSSANQGFHLNQARLEAAAAGLNVPKKIALSDQEFGKY